MAISHGFPPLTYVSSYFFHYLDFSHHLLLFSFHYDNHLHIWIDVSFKCYENDHNLRQNRICIWNNVLNWQWIMKFYPWLSWTRLSSNWETKRQRNRISGSLRFKTWSPIWRPMTKVWSQNDILRRHGDQTNCKIEPWL